MKRQCIAPNQQELNLMLVEQFEQISVVCLNFHDIAFSDSPQLLTALQGAVPTSMPGLS